MNASNNSDLEAWPSQPLDAWRQNYAALHLWTQIVGKIRLSLSPWVNHSWHTTLYVTATGLTTSAIAYGSRRFQIDFDFLEHQLWLRSSDGRSARLALEPQSVASFYRRLMDEMHKLDLMCASIADPTRLRNQYRSIRMLLRDRTMPITLPAFGEFSNRPMGSSRCSARDSLVNAARCIFFGVRPIWR